jgi:hypothetical protein
MTDKLSNEDFFLQNLVSLVNGSKDMRIGLTLTVGGTLISGVIIGGMEYFDKFSSQFITGYKLDTDDKSQELMNKYFDSYKKIYTSPLTDDEEKQGPAYIHLDNVRIYQEQNKPIPTNDGMLWRGKISDVQGFTLGVISAS